MDFSWKKCIKRQERTLKRRYAQMLKNGDQTNAKRLKQRIERHTNG